jgi:hypothetical protein
MDIAIKGVSVICLFIGADYLFVLRISRDDHLHGVAVPRWIPLAGVPEAFAEISWRTQFKRRIEKSGVRQRRVIASPARFVDNQPLASLPGHIFGFIEILGESRHRQPEQWPNVCEPSAQNVCLKAIADLEETQDQA